MKSVRPILCLGEVIVDLICDRPLSAGQVPESLVPHPGGALANVAVAVARAGVPAAVAGGVGDDIWGDWLERRLTEAGVSTRWLARMAGGRTPLGIALLDRGGEPAFQIYGEHIGPTMAAGGRHLAAALAEAGALVIGSNTMVGPTEREVTRRAVTLAGEAHLPVLLDPNYRPRRWDDPDKAREYSLELVESATVVKCNRQEAALLTGESEPVAAARGLMEIGPKLVVVTDGDGWIVCAGATGSRLLPDPVAVVSPLGAGDAFMGALTAGLAGLDWDLSRAGEILAPAAAAAARACGRYGAQA